MLSLPLGRILLIPKQISFYLLSYVRAEVVQQDVNLAEYVGQ